jgi:hypothetical protein
MRHLLIVASLLACGVAAAQPDARQIRTVQIDDGEVRVAQPDAPQARTKTPAKRQAPIKKPVELQKRPKPPVEPQESAGADDTQESARRADQRQDDLPNPDEHLALARKLVDFGPDSNGPAEASANCVPDPATMRKDIGAAYRANPAEFHGISPQSAYWPEVEQAWRDYYVDRCGPQSDESPAAIIARRYAANLSTGELREVVAFQQSPAGRAFIAATRIARQDLESPPETPSRRDADEASTTFRKAILRLKALYERAPK